MSVDARPGSVLLDTCAAIWLAGRAPMDPAALEIVAAAGNLDGIHVSVVTAWEIGQLSRREIQGGRTVSFLPDAKAWFRRLLRVDGIRLADLTPEIAVDATMLPGEFHRDPGDRLIVSSARHRGIPIVTRDREILAYAASGHVQAVRC